MPSAPGLAIWRKPVTDRGRNHGGSVNTLARPEPFEGQRCGQYRAPRTGNLPEFAPATDFAPDIHLRPASTRNDRRVTARPADLRFAQQTAPERPRPGDFVGTLKTMNGVLLVLIVLVIGAIGVAV